MRVATIHLRVFLSSPLAGPWKEEEKSFLLKRADKWASSPSPPVDRPTVRPTPSGPALNHPLLLTPSGATLAPGGAGWDTPPLLVMLLLLLLVVMVLQVRGRRGRRGGVAALALRRRRRGRLRLSLVMLVRAC